MYFKEECIMIPPKKTHGITQTETQMETQTKTQTKATR